MTAKRVSFKAEDGHNLSGVLHFPIDGQVKAYALFAHCFTCTKNINAATNIAQAMARAGIATLRFDFTGLGASKGKFANTSFSSNINDLIAAASFLETKYEAPQIIVGHSLGGTAVLYAAQKIASIKAVASIAAPASPAHVLHLLAPKLEELANEGEAQIDIGGYKQTFRQCFVDDARSHDLDFGQLKKAVLIMHGPFDNLVSIDEANKIYHALKHPKSFISLDKADHLLSRDEDAQYAGLLIANWATRYIDSAPVEIIDGVIVAADKDAGFLTNILADGHVLIADEPGTLGGTDLGPTPYSLLSAGLGACTTMTLNMYARRKKLDLKRVRVQITHNRVHQKDCEDCEKPSQKIDQFTRVISLEGNLSDKEKQRLMEIADRCPVHRTLENTIKIVTQKTDEQ